MDSIISAIRDFSWIGAGVGILLALICRYIYRLTLHPLARFPGPKFAGASSLYGAFFDLGGKSYVKSFPALHEKYGPIVRAWPNTLHICDMEVYNQIFKIGSHFDKLAIFYNNPTLAGGFFADACRDTALPRKNMYAASFSREAIRRAEPRVAACVTKFLDNLSRSGRDGKPVNITKGLMCYTMDAVMNFVYQKPFGALEAENFDSDYLVPIVDFVSTLQWAIYFPKTFEKIFKMTNMLPERTLEKYLKGFVTTQEMLKKCNSGIKDLLSVPTGEDRPSSVFDTTLSPNPEKGQFTPSEQNLTADAFTFMSAGTETSSQTLEVAVFNLLDGPPHMLERLKGEVRQVVPEKRMAVEWATLEKLPYLRAVIKESLRLSYGIPGRIPRVVPPGGATFCGQHVPPGVLVASSTYIHHMNPKIFPSPEEFRPERWLDGDPKLEQYLVSFSRGSRACLGINLAYCELYLLLAHLFRRFDLQLAGTSKRDMEWIDCFVPKRNANLFVTVREVGE